MRSHCPINFSLEHFGDKWSLLIIRDLMFKGKRHYNQFLESDEHVSTTVLRDKLRLLEQGGIISRENDHVKKSRIRYGLTEKGISLRGVMVELILWGGKFDKETEAEKAFLLEASKNKEEFLSNLGKKLVIDHLTGERV